MQALRTYRVSYDDFFSFAGDPNLRRDFETVYEQCSGPMSELIEKYGLHSKRVLSVGSSLGYEEYCFYENGCSLTFCDIDEHKIIEPFLRRLEPSDDEKALTYVIGDARELANVLEDKFDIHYLSSFTPNELRNRYVRRAYRMPYLRRLLDATLGRLRLDHLYRGLWSWPNDEQPILDSVIRVADNSLDRGGYFVYQSYASGVYARESSYVNSIKLQLESIGLRLLTVYYFKNYPNIHLVVGFRGPPEEALRVSNAVRGRKEITAFHGRSIGVVDSGGLAKAYDLSAAELETC